MNAEVKPPFAAQSESAILARIITSEGDAWEAVNESGSLKAEAFYEYRHQVIFAAMESLIERHGRLDLLALGSELDKTQQLDDAGGMKYLVELSLMIVSESGKATQQHAAMVSEAHAKRKLMTLASELTELATTGQIDVEQIVSTATAKLDVLAESVTGSDDNNLFVGDCQCVVDDILTQDDPAAITTLRKTRFDQLDGLIGGLRPGNLIVIAGRPGSGKTSLALNIAVNTAIDPKGDQLPSLVFSHEMPRSQLIHRLIADSASVPVNLITNRQCSSSDLLRINQSWQNVVSDYKIIINDKQGMTPDQIEVNSRRVKRKHGLGIVVIDFLQLLKSVLMKGENKASAIGRTTKALKQMSSELDIPVILLSQLNRGVDLRPDKRPVMSDLRDSGEIEEDADLILMVYRDEYYNADSPEKGTAEVIVAKNRFGSQGIAKLGFDSSYTRFKNMKVSYPEKPPLATYPEFYDSEGSF